MYSLSIYSTVVLTILLNIHHQAFAGPSSLPSFITSFNINSKKSVHTVNERFLSFTVDLETLLHVAECKTSNATLNMARSLLPAYLRVAGNNSNKFLFQPAAHSGTAPEKDPNFKLHNFSITGLQWLKLNEFMSKIGLDVIACVNGGIVSEGRSWDLSNTLELITFSDKNNLNLDWQIGYETQKNSKIDAKSLGHDVTRLRKILDVFPRYRKSLIVGPDMTSLSNRDDITFIRNYLSEAGDSLNAVTWHPFTNSPIDEDNMLTNGLNTMDNTLWFKDGLLKSTFKGVVPKKSIWIAESDEKNSVSNLTDSMVWLKRLGTAAKHGISVYLRRPHLLSFYEPTPEFWFSALYKALVGKTVLEMRQVSGNSTDKVFLFTHCTQVFDKPEDGIINPTFAYEKGSVTVYGANMGSEVARVSFKVNFKTDETAHLYVLTEELSGGFPKTFLNKQVLGLSTESELPMLSPKVRTSPSYLTVPPKSIFFIVFPETKCRACMQLTSDDQEFAKSKVKLPEAEDTETNVFTNNVLEAMEADNEHDSVYVSYPKRNENFIKWIVEDTTENDLKPKSDTPTESGSNIKYVTFSDDTWLSAFPEKLKDAFNKERSDPKTERSSKADKYRLFAQAILGRRNITNFANYKKNNGYYQYADEAGKPIRFNGKEYYEYVDDGGRSDFHKHNGRNINRFKRSPVDTKDVSVQKPSSSMDVQFKPPSDGSHHTETSNKNSVMSRIYIYPVNNQNVGELVSLLKAEQFKQVQDLPVLNLIPYPKSDQTDTEHENEVQDSQSTEESSDNERRKRETNVSKNVTSIKSEEKTNSSDAKLEAKTNSTKYDISEYTQDEEVKEREALLVMLMDPAVMSTSAPINPIAESDNSTISRQNREIQDRVEGTHVPKMLGPVSPFPKKPKIRVIRKNSDILQSTHAEAHNSSNRVEVSPKSSSPVTDGIDHNSEKPIQLVSVHPTQQVNHHPELTHHPDVHHHLESLHHHSEPKSADVSKVTDHQKSALDKSDYDLADPVQPESARQVHHDPVHVQQPTPRSKPDHHSEPVHHPKSPPAHHLKPNSVHHPKPVPARHPEPVSHRDTEPAHRPQPVHRSKPEPKPAKLTKEELNSKVQELLDQHKIRLEQLKRKIAKSAKDSHVHKRETILDEAIESTKSFFADLTDDASDKFHSFKHWLGDRAHDLAHELKRSKRDINEIQSVNQMTDDYWHQLESDGLPFTEEEFDKLREAELLEWEFDNNQTPAGREPRGWIQKWANKNWGRTKEDDKTPSLWRSFINSHKYHKRDTTDVEDQDSQSPQDQSEKLQVAKAEETPKTLLSKHAKLQTDVREKTELQKISDQIKTKIEGRKARTEGSLNKLVSIQHPKQITEVQEGLKEKIKQLEEKAKARLDELRTQARGKESPKSADQSNARKSHAEENHNKPANNQHHKELENRNELKEKLKQLQEQAKVRMDEIRRKYRTKETNVREKRDLKEVLERRNESKVAAKARREENRKRIASKLEGRNVEVKEKAEELRNAAKLRIDEARKTIQDRAHNAQRSVRSTKVQHQPSESIVSKKSKSASVIKAPRNKFSSENRIQKRQVDFHDTENYKVSKFKRSLSDNEIYDDKDKDEKEAFQKKYYKNQFFQNKLVAKIGAKESDPELAVTNEKIPKITNHLFDKDVDFMEDDSAESQSDTRVQSFQDESVKTTVPPQPQDNGKCQYQGTSNIFSYLWCVTQRFFRNIFVRFRPVG